MDVLDNNDCDDTDPNIPPNTIELCTEDVDENR